MKYQMLCLQSTYYKTMKMSKTIVLLQELMIKKAVKDM